MSLIEYEKARRGEIRDFTGIDDPYEPPLAPEITLETVTQSAEQNARLILDHLIALGFVRGDEHVRTATAKRAGD
jgi:sulfate adenylyltransferase